MKSQKCKNKSLQKQNNYFGDSFDRQTVAELFKSSGLSIETISSKLCISYETCRNQLYSKRLSAKLWIKYYQFFTNFTKK